MKNVRKELQEVLINPFKERNASGEPVIPDLLTFENMQELTYYGWCFNESLRIQAPVNFSSQCTMLEDVKAGPYTIGAKDLLCIDMYHLHRNKKQWKEPERYIPDRFNPQSPYYLTPAGKKRHPLAFAPFFGGKRICIGKTFAETVSRMIGPSLIGSFDFEYYGKDQKPEVLLVQVEETEVFVNIKVHDYN